MLRLSSRLRPQPRLSPKKWTILSPQRLYTTNALLLTSDDSSSSAGSSSHGPQHLPPPSEEEYISDREWELRTGMTSYIQLNNTNLLEGHAMDVLQQTLPTFFNTGLIATNYHLPLHIHSILGASHKGKGRADEHECETCDEEGIYAKTIRLEYTPPVALPAPLPRMLKVEGLPLYVASSVFLRHGMHALYTDLAVAIHKAQIHSGTPSNGLSSSNSPPVPEISKDTQRKQRERAITIGLLVSGRSRLGLSNESAEWDVTTTYTFSPRTGRIILHTVNAIHPAPSETVYAAFQSVMSSLGSGIGAGGRKGAMNIARGDTHR